MINLKVLAQLQQEFSLISKIRIVISNILKWKGELYLFSFPLTLLPPFKLLQRPSQLVRARRRSWPALDSVQPADGLIHVHALDEAGQALCIAGAAAYELDIGQFIIFHFKGYLPGTDPLCFISHV